MVNQTEHSDCFQHLAADEARFVTVPSAPFGFIAGNNQFLSLVGISSCGLSICGIKLLYAKLEDSSLLEEAMIKASHGIESACCVFLAEQCLALNIRAIPILDSENCMQYIVCTLSAVAYTVDFQSNGLGQAILSSNSPYHVEDSNEEWCASWGYSKEEIVGRSIKLLQGPKTNEWALSTLLDHARRGLEFSSVFTAYKKDGTETTVRLRARPIFLPGLPLRHFAVESHPCNTVRESNFEDEQKQFCEYLQSLTFDDTPTRRQEEEQCGCRRNPNYSELVLALPPDVHPFCLTLLWTLKQRLLVDSWCWEDGILRVKADIDMLFECSGVQCGNNAWLLRLIEAAYRTEAMATSCAGDCYDAPISCEDAATDFSFLGCDYPMVPPI